MKIRTNLRSEELEFIGDRLNKSISNKRSSKKFVPRNEVEKMLFNKLKMSFDMTISGIKNNIYNSLLNSEDM